MELGWNMVAELLWGVQVLTATCCVIYMLLVLSQALPGFRFWYENRGKNHKISKETK